MDLRSGILSTANALGVSPLDLATAISYETAGTFDPSKRGPTTQWGEHRGLIQFGEPQAKKYGVDWNQPLRSQLGPQGAVANYLRDTGVEPGMGLLDIYSAINAGGVGRYNRSDAHNGGAPGTVRDKVEQQMSSHRQKAQTLLGDFGISTTVAGSAGQDTLEAPMQEKSGGLLGSLFPDMTAARADEIRLGVNGLLHNPNQGKERAIYGRMAQRQQAAQGSAKDQKAQAQINKTVEMLRSQGAPEYLVAAAASGQAGAALQEFLKMKGPQQGPKPTDDMREYNLAVSQGYEGTLQDWLISQRQAGAAQTTINTGDQGQRYGTVPPGYARIEDPNSEAGVRLVPIPGGAADVEAQQTAEQRQEADQARESAQTTQKNVVTDTITRLRNELNNPGIVPDVGVIGSKTTGVNQQAANISGMLDTLKGMVVFDRLEKLKAASATGASGLGQVTEREISLLGAQLGALENTLSPDLILNTLDTVESVFTKLSPEAQSYLMGEGGDEVPMSGSAPSPTSQRPDFSKMTIKELEAYIEEQEGR